MRAKRLRIVLAVLSVAALAGGLASGQDWHVGRGRLEGTITSATGQPIVGATVALRYGGNGPDLKTDKKGHWAILGLVGGSWDVDVSAPGFQSKKISINVGEINRNPPINLSLAPEEKQEAPRTEVQVGGKTISKEAAAAIEKGNAASKAKNYAEAEESYLKALPELPEEPSLLANLALNYYFDNKPEQALGFARKLAAVDPKSTTAWLMIAELELQKGNLEAGQEAMAKVPEENVSSPEPYMNLGILSYNKKKLAEADDAFTKAIAKKPDLAQAYYYRGLERYQAKRIADARADLQKSIELDPSGKDSETAKEILKTMK
ncbi:MAG TPA: tetratricopeptide repeat protein [Thermoanaerobaculia bacterium]|nr:tetratricopeptide repeat protein [Thermoanaerobaculia bacterium]